MNEQNDNELLIIPIAWGVDEDGVPIDQDDVSTDYQARAEALEQLVRDCLLCIKDISDYHYQKPRVADLLDRAAELGIIPEVQGA